MDPVRVSNQMMMMMMMMMILLIPRSHQKSEKSTTAEPNHSMEFCLHVPGDSHWSTSKPDQPTPTVTKHPPTNRPSTQQTIEPRPDTSVDAPEHTEHTEHTTQQPEPITDPPPTTEEKIAHPLRSSPRCRCDNKKKKLPTETSLVKRIKVLYPMSDCHTLQIIESLNDGSEVCIIAQSLQSYVNEFVRPQPKKPITTVPPTTEPTTTPDWDFNSFGEYEVYTEIMPQCTRHTSDLKNITPEDVLSLLLINRKMPIFVNLKDGSESICVDLPNVEFQNLLEKLGALSSTVNECHCRGTGKLPDVYRSLQNAIIWFPSDTCNSTEYIETLMDDSEECVTPHSLHDYVYSVIHHQKKQEPKPDTASYIINEPKVVEVNCVFLACPWVDWKTIDSKDVESLQIDKYSSKCPIHLIIKLKKLDGRPDFFCVSTQEPWFSDMLEKLAIN